MSKLLEPATHDQHQYIRRLIQNKALTDEAKEAVRKGQAIAKEGKFTKGDAGELIGVLRPLPNKPRPGRARP
jgi:hypothetical protein